MPKKQKSMYTKIKKWKKCDKDIKKINKINKLEYFFTLISSIILITALIFGISFYNKSYTNFEPEQKLDKIIFSLDNGIILIIFFILVIILVIFIWFILKLRDKYSEFDLSISDLRKHYLASALENHKNSNYDKAIFCLEKFKNLIRSKDSYEDLYEKIDEYLDKINEANNPEKSIKNTFEDFIYFVVNKIEKKEKDPFENIIKNIEDTNEEETSYYNIIKSILDNLKLKSHIVFIILFIILLIAYFLTKNYIIVLIFMVLIAAWEINSKKK